MRNARLLSLAFLAVAAVHAARLRRHLRVGRSLADAARRFEKREGNGRFRVLVIGDSSGVGTGADSPHHSVAGRLAQACPDIVIWNIAENGLRTAGLLAPLRALRGKSFDAVLVHIGVNDIIHRTPLPLLRQQLAAALMRARRLSRHVFVLTGGNLGLAPALPPGLRWLVTRRTREVRQLFLEVTAGTGAVYVDMFDGVVDRPFVENPRRFFAPDGFHPNSDGYALWYDVVTKEMRKAGIDLR